MEVNGTPLKAFIDSGAQVWVVPGVLYYWSYYYSVLVALVALEGIHTTCSDQRSFPSGRAAASVL